MINVFGSLTGEAELSSVADCLRRNWMGAGVKVAAFEGAFAETRGLVDFVMVASGSAALHLAVHLLDLPPGSDIILPSFTWIACAQAVALCGHRPVFCDVDYKTQNVTVQTVKTAIAHSQRIPGAIMIVHYAGRPVDIEPILRLGYPVIEDAAHAVVSDFSDGSSCGSKGTIGIFSFDAVKNLACPEGGGLTAAPDLCERARNLRYCGIGKSAFESRKQSAPWWELNVAGVFPKVLCNDVAAAIALEQLKKLPRLQKTRDRIFDFYMHELGALEATRGMELPHGLLPEHSRFTYLIRCKRRNALALYLMERDVYTTLRYSPLHKLPLYDQITAQLPNSNSLNESGLNLPLHPGMTLDDAATVVQLVKKFYAL